MPIELSELGKLDSVPKKVRKAKPAKIKKPKKGSRTPYWRLGTWYECRKCGKKVPIKRYSTASDRMPKDMTCKECKESDSNADTNK